MSPWFWIASIFGAQALGALLVSPWLKVSLDEIRVPVAILVFATAAAAFLGWRDRSRTMNRWLSLFPAALYAAFIFSLSNRSFHGAELSFKADYFHLVEFCTLSIFLSCFWAPVLRRGRFFAFILCVVATGVAYGLTDELHQAFIPGRDSNPFDIVWDTVGLTMGCIIYLAATWLHDRLLSSTA